MPLSPAAPRKHIHTRTVQCRGYERDDGLWDVEGHLVDTKTYAFPNRHRGQVEAGEPVHEMWVRLTVDDDLVIREVEAVTDHGPYASCPAITSNFARLKGLRIGAGLHREIHKRVGGVEGCTHLVELLRPLATTVYQTLVPLKVQRGQMPAKPEKRPAIIDSCHVYASDGEVVRESWPAFYTGPKSA